MLLWEEAVLRLGGCKKLFDHRKSSDGSHWVDDFVTNESPGPFSYPICFLRIILVLIR